MAISEHTRIAIEAVAKHTLGTFKIVKDAAQEKLTATTPPIGLGNEPDIIHPLKKIKIENAENYRSLIREPAIARVTVCDKHNKKYIYYICRSTPVPVGDKDFRLASYRAPTGRLAALSVGQKTKVPIDGHDVFVEILEKTQLEPVPIGQEWDSRNSVLEGASYGGVITVESFKGFLTHGLVAEADTTPSADILEGRRRSVIKKIALRDQPVLDRYQDEIFRLPFDSSLLLLGAPGTGKTTTLIRRLGQKLDSHALDEREKKLVEQLSEGSDVEHEKNWIMFTPTELLRLYVKEAFAREGIASPDERISKWTDFRHQLAKHKFGLLQSSSGGGKFVMNEDIDTLLPETKGNQTSWFADFDDWQKAYMWRELRSAAERMSEAEKKLDNRILSEESEKKYGDRILSTIDKEGETLSPTVLMELQRLAPDIRTRLSEMKGATDKRIDQAFAVQVNRDQNFVGELAKFLDSLSDIGDESDEMDLNEKEDAAPSKAKRVDPEAEYAKVARSQAQSTATKRSISKSTRTGCLIDWLGDRLLGDEDRLEVGQSLVVQSQLRRFVNPIQRYIDSIPSRYGLFRRERQNKGKWYLSDGYEVKDIHPLEVDLILLALLREADELVNKFWSTNGDGAENVPALTLQRGLYRNQVFVDEATDFSPLQLGCMIALTYPYVRSFFACGDFNQRITDWGTRSIEDMQWALGDIASKSIAVAYRQSAQLHELAKQLVVQSGGDETDAELQDFVDNDGVAPVLATNLSQQADVVDWLAGRIVEIEKSVQPLPSIAVLVNDERESRPLATALGEALKEQNIRVQACPNGQVLGLDDDVKVFDVQHIKGLEFEAVFFVGVDQLAQTHPDVFDKYLYVGATRAATYLGLTCEQRLPESIVGLADIFEENWKQLPTVGHAS